MTVREWILEHGRQYSLSALLATVDGNQTRALFWTLAGEELKRLLMVLDPKDFAARKRFAEEIVPNA